MRKWRCEIIFLLAVLSAFDISWAAERPDKKISVFVSILPQADFVKRVGGEHVEVEVLVGPGQSPATYEPTPRQVSRLSRSMAYFRIGVPFENMFIKRMPGVLKGLDIIDMRRGVELRYFRRSKGHEAPDPHIWLDPKRVKILADTVSKALARIDPANKAVFKDNLRSFQSDLDRLDNTISDTLTPLKGERIYVFHPAFGYFCDSYGLIQVAVETEGKGPGPKGLASLIRRARADRVKVIFVQPQYAKKAAHTIASAIGGAVVPMNPLPRDYFKALEGMAAKVQNALLKR